MDVSKVKCNKLAHSWLVDENVGKLQEVQDETRHGHEGAVLVVESRLVERTGHPVGQRVLESDHELVDELLQGLVLVVVVARGQHVVDDDATRGGDRRVDTVHLLLAFLRDARLLQLAVIVHVQASADLHLVGVDGLAAVASAIGFVDQVLAGER